MHSKTTVHHHHHLISKSNQFSTPHYSPLIKIMVSPDIIFMPQPVKEI